MEIELNIDIRENKQFIDLLLQNVTNVTIKTLELGDIEFIINGEKIIVIERKEINDLASSLHDGRYHEQKVRLKALNNTRARIIYLIEGDYNQLNKKYHNKFDIEKYKGCIINTMIRDDIHIYKTGGMKESVEYIKDIMKRLPGYVDILVNKNVEKKYDNIENVEIEYSNNIKFKKKDNITSKVCFISQLSQIPKVSVNTAQYLVNKYNTIENLIHEYDRFEGDKEKMVKDEKIGNRKIGPVSSKYLYQYLYGIGE